MRLPQDLRAGVIAWMPDGKAWAESLPALLEGARQRWQLTVGEPFEGGYTAWVAPAERADGSLCVLKLQYPDELSRHEGDALLMWGGIGAVRLLDRDESSRALLLERLLPGTTLFAIADPEEALTLACAALARLWRPPAAVHPFPTAQASATTWAGDVERLYREHGEPFDVALKRGSVAAFERLAAYDGDECVVLHQDFHRGNVLRGQREPWLAIDPKPVVGERAFDARWLLYDLLYREPRSPLDPIALLDRLASELSLEAERVRLWTLARAVENALWSFDSGEPPGDDLALAEALM
jgi:streptomycin 6-kinase